MHRVVILRRTGSTVTLSAPGSAEGRNARWRITKPVAWRRFAGRKVVRGEKSRTKSLCTYYTMQVFPDSMICGRKRVSRGEVNIFVKRRNRATHSGSSSRFQFKLIQAFRKAEKLRIFSGNGGELQQVFLYAHNNGIYRCAQ